MADPQMKSKTVPGGWSVPGQDAAKQVPIINMHPMSPMVEKFLVPAAWFAGGILFAKLFLRSKSPAQPTFGGF